MVPLADLFDCKRGTNLDLNALDTSAPEVAYVSCTGKNNGVSARVRRISGLEPVDGGVISLALVGQIMSAFVQEEPFYSAQNIAVLTPRIPMSRNVLLFYAACLQTNEYRFSFGRKANRTYRALPVPAPHMVPEWVDGAFQRVSASLKDRLPSHARLTVC
jgi:hypothetical protein